MTNYFINYFTIISMNYIENSLSSKCSFSEHSKHRKSVSKIIRSSANFEKTLNNQNCLFRVSNSSNSALKMRHFCDILSLLYRCFIAVQSTRKGKVPVFFVFQLYANFTATLRLVFFRFPIVRLF